MFEKLRKRFVSLSALILLGVIVVVAGIVYSAGSRTIMSQSHIIAKNILENGGKITYDQEFTQVEEQLLSVNSDLLREVRYVSVRIPEGTIVDSRFFALEEEEAAELAAAAVEKARGNGGIYHTDSGHAYVYEKSVAEDGTGLIVLLDASQQYWISRRIMLYMIGMWLVVLLIYFVLMLIYSRRMIRPFIENDERQKRFITNASHELKTPVAVIAANTEMIEALNGESKWTESTLRQTGRLQRLIEELVVLARVDEMKQADLSDVDMAEIVRATAEPYRSVVESGGQSFSVAAPKTLIVRGEQRSLAELTTILTDNAAKYCDEGGRVSVALTEGPRGKGARLTVSNTYAAGAGEDYNKFFERFYRADESHNSRKEGFGIGLSMAKEIAERLSGRLTVDYQGDTISFVLEVR